MKTIPCAIYARVSSDKQAEGDSIEHQISLAKEHIARLGEEFYSDDNLIYKDEGISGYSTTLLDRPAIQRMFEDAKQNKFKVAVFKELSRASRDGEESIKVPRIFKSYGVRVIGINDMYDSMVPDTEILLSIQGVLAEKESEKIGTRVSSGQREKARKGQWATVAPIGYKINKETKKLEINPETIEIVKLIFKMYVTDRVGTETIANHLNQSGLTTPKGSIWDKMSINRILKNVVYTGTVSYGKTRSSIKRIYEHGNLIAKQKKLVKREDSIHVEDAHESIISKETFLKAAEIMQSRVKGEFKGNRAKHPLIGLLRCSKCGESFVCQSRTSEKYHYRYYKCSTRHRFGSKYCQQDNIIADDLEREIFNFVVEKLNKVNNEKVYVKGKIESDSIEAKVKNLNNDRKKLIQKQFGMTKDRDLYTDEAFREVMLGIKKEIEFLELQINTMESQLLEIQKRTSNNSFIEELVEKLKNIDLSNQLEIRALFHELIQFIEIEDKDTIKKIKYKYSFV